MKREFYGLVWDNYMGSGYVKEISQDEYEQHRANAGNSLYWGVYDDYFKADYALDMKYMD